MRKILAVIMVIALAGCARDFYTTYNGKTSRTGEATIKLSAPMRNVSVTMNDSLIVDEKFTEQIVINHIPAGEYRLKVIGTDGRRKNDLNYTETLTITPGSHKTILTEVPGLSTGYWVYSAVVYLASFGLSYYFIY